MRSHKTQKKSILIISHSYAPLLNPRAFRWTTIAEQFVQKGYVVDIITSWQPGLAREEKFDGISIFRIGGSSIEKIRSRFSSIDKKTKADNTKIDDNNQSTFNSIIKATLHFIHDNTWKKIYWPDYAALWKKPAIKSALYLLENENYDRMITVSDPFTSHLVGQEIKKHFPNLFWLVDIGDPFCFRQGSPANNYTLYENKNYQVEETIFSNADSVSVTNENTKLKYAELFPQSSEKIDVMPPLLASSNDLQHTNMFFEPNNKIRLVFIGTLYKYIRNPKYLLKMFDKLMRSDLQSKIELHLFGALNDTREEFDSYSKYLNKSLFLHGLVERDTVLQVMNEASVLINISNDNIYQLPSKLVEYMNTGNAIINIAYVKQDISGVFLSDYSSQLTLDNTPDSSFDIEYQKCYSFLINLPKKLSTKAIDNYTNKYSPAIIANQYLQANKIIKKPNSMQESLS